VIYSLSSRHALDLVLRISHIDNILDADTAGLPLVGIQPAVPVVDVEAAL
jgi:hypothetical protein